MSSDHDSILPGEESGLRPHDAPTGTEQNRFDASPSAAAIDTEFTARDRLLDRAVRIRRFANQTGDAAAQRARLLARLEDAGAPPVFDLREDGNGTLLVSRSVDGITLGEAIRMAAAGRAPREIADATACAQTAARIAARIATAHRMGVVHRRLDTEGVVLAAADRIFILGWDEAASIDQRPLTLRYSASVRADNAAALIDDAHADIRAIGRLIIEMLLLRPAMAEGSDPVGTITEERLDRWPPLLEGIARSALSSDSSRGYADAATLVKDLQAAAILLAAKPYRPSRIERTSVWMRRRAAALLLATLAVAVIGTATLWWMNTRASATDWDQTVYAGAFEPGRWSEHWIPDRPGAFVQVGTALRSASATTAWLVHRQRLKVPVAIEYEALIEPDSHPGDLSVLWSERDEVSREPWKLDDGSARVLRIQAGAFDNTVCMIRDDPGLRPFARANLRLDSGRLYRFRVELRSDSARMLIDGHEVMSAHLDAPLTSGYLALYGHYAGKTFQTARVLRPSLQAEPSPLAVADAMMQARHVPDAIAHYGRVAEESASTDPELADLALFRKGQAEMGLAQHGAARRSWEGIRDAAMRKRCQILLLDGLVAEGQHLAALDHLRAAWPNADAATRTLIIRHWQLWASGLREPSPLMDAFVSFRSSLFPDDPLTGEQAGNLLVTRKRFREVIEGYRDYSYPLAHALIAVGRGAEVVDAPWAEDYLRTYAAWATGNLAAILRNPHATPRHRALALCRSGSPLEALDLTPDRHPALIHLGRGTEQLTIRPISGDVANEALMSLGRFSEAAGDGIPGIEGSGHNVTALRLLGRDAEADAIDGSRHRGIALIRALEDGDAAALAEAMAAIRSVVAEGDQRAFNALWFSHLILLPYAAGQGTLDEAAWRSEMRRVMERYPVLAAQRVRHVAAYLAGAINEEGLRRIPYVNEVEAWVALAEGLRADVAKDASGAIAAYRRFQSLPMHRRLLHENHPSPEVERFVAWRLKRLTAMP